MRVAFFVQRSIAVVVGLSFVATAGHAQQCRGMGSFVYHPVALAGGISFSDTTFNVRGSVAGGTRGLFAQITVRGSRTDVPDEWKVKGGSLFGYEVDLNERHSASLCPLLSVSRNVLGLGVTIGFEATRNDRVTVVPAFQLGGGYRRIKTTGTGGGEVYDSEVTGTIGATLGLMFGSRVNLNYFGNVERRGRDWQTSN